MLRRARALKGRAVRPLALGSDVARFDGYCPPPESQGGWRWLEGPDDVRALAGLEPDRLYSIVARTGTGPPAGGEQGLIESIVAAVIPEA